MSGFSPRVKAVLGPTNTGKTHLAIERMLGHSSGIIGFPLRLLARENYDRMVARKGLKNVALITGEEKIVPPGAKYFSCTVEAMPLDRRVEFLAVDEIQLCADADRGHIFTDRLLHARGLVETMFLGAETIRRLLKRLIPDAEIETRPRLSELSYAGPAKLSRLPPRSAIVAFSSTEVYAIAEAVRRRRGGCAVVMGRLSPRTRNAQVALYQAKEVDFLVATDAIGMGLNMDVDHVGFAGLSKFDGHRPRLLLAPEVAQIAGRAGRGMRDGTFGVTANCPPLADELVNAVESHAFEPLEQLCWRNSDLDFASTDTLLASLMAPPPVQGLVRGQDATDAMTLATLSMDPDIRRAAQGRIATKMLWDACQIPDFRKLANDWHAKLCARVFTHLRQDKTLPVDWIAGQFEGLDKTEGDIDTLMQRLADVRVWAYITARADWMKDATPWQNRAREIEDKISDTLHEKLMARFVDKRAAHLTRRLEAKETEDLLSVVSARGVVLVEGHEVGHVDGFNFYPDPSTQGQEKKLVLRAARRALAQEMPRRILRAETAEDSAFSITDTQKIMWEGAEIAKLRKGTSILRPAVEILPSEFIDGAARERLRLRIATFMASSVDAKLVALNAVMADPPPPLRGLVHRLGEALGVLPGEAPPQADKAALKSLGIMAGSFAVFMPALLKPHAAAMRALLWALWNGVETPKLPPAGLVSIPGGGNPDFALMMGWLPAGPVMIRLDIAEKLGREWHYLIRKHPVPLPPNLASRLSIKPDALPAVLNVLGLRIIPAATLREGVFGPPAPPMLARRKHQPVKPTAAAPPPPPPEPPPADSPFAALAALKLRAPAPVTAATPHNKRRAS
ncbi:MAG: DNA helicase [Acidocella sp. 20-57-95]|nr:MAG: DNA helicase [Acidocella sp. 20-57-95]OYV62499.1 MAG: DNA helicase [Acidocella sp. 21-58-7]HQT64082.1 helicase-related protein [Acidocella sp.]